MAEVPELQVQGVVTALVAEVPALQVQGAVTALLVEVRGAQVRAGGLVAATDLVVEPLAPQKADL